MARWWSIAELAESNVHRKNVIAQKKARQRLPNRNHFSTSFSKEDGTFHIVVQVQAGDEAWGEGIHYNLQVLLQDITKNYTNILNKIVQGNLQDPNWKTQSSLFHFSVVSGAAGSVYQSSVFLTAGFRDPGVSFRVDFPIVVHSGGETV